ncbi:MAG: family 16 glycosylhydrolase [Eubacteriaceae bacterium]
MKKSIRLTLSFVLVFALFMAATFSGYVQAAETSSDSDTAFYDDFSGSSLDTSKWLVASKNWGGTDKTTGQCYNGGVIPENVSVADGKLVLTGNGNLYTGNLKGINKDGSVRTDGKRTGAAIATKDYYGSGSYEITAKISPELGACSAMWTFEYEEYYPGDALYKKMPVGGNDYYAVNHEIDIEMPGRPNAAHVDQSFNYALCNTWIGENNSEETTHYTDIGTAQNDGQYHTYRFDWHTGDDGVEPCVEFYFDGVLTYRSTTNIPTNKSRLWLGLWFPNGWAGTPDFDTTAFEIDSVKITPFHESGDTEQHESFPNDGWAVVTEPENPGTSGGTGDKGEGGSESGGTTGGDTSGSETSSTNLITNGDFTDGSSGWTLSGGAAAGKDCVLLASGSDTDSMTQTVTVKPSTTYTLQAGITTPGAIVQYGVRDYNGRYTELSQTADADGNVKLTFTTASWIREVTVYFQVLRYQTNTDSASISKVSLTEGTGQTSPDTDHQGGSGDVSGDGSQTGGSESGGSTDTGSGGTTGGDTGGSETASTNLLVNGNFTDGINGWILSGSAASGKDCVLLASGSDTDTCCQKVQVKPNTTYVLTADVLSSGSEIEFGVRDYNARYSNLHDTSTADGVKSIEFTTGSGTSSLTVYAQVLRYQTNSSPCTLQSLTLTEK